MTRAGRPPAPVLLHAWGEDIARLMGVGRFISEGASERILKRALDSYRT